MAGLDWRVPISLREGLSFTKSQVVELDRRIWRHPAVEGCVLLSTCNRTELYLSCGAGAAPDPAALLCEAAGADPAPFAAAFVIDGAELKNGALDTLCDEIRDAVQPDSLRVISDIALIAVVGHGMARSVGTSARLFEAIARAGVNVRMIDQGSSELNIIVGVDNDSYERMLKAVYEEFFE